MAIKRAQALQYVSFGVTDALSIEPASKTPKGARLVGWQCGFEPMFVAVWSYLSPDGAGINDDEAVELATDALLERGWFSSGPATEPDHII